MPRSELFRPRSRQGGDQSSETVRNNTDHGATSVSLSQRRLAGGSSPLSRSQRSTDVRHDPRISEVPVPSVAAQRTFAGKENLKIIDSNLCLDRLHPRKSSSATTLSTATCSVDPRPKLSGRTRSIRKRVFSKVKEGVRLRSLSSAGPIGSSEETTSTLYQVVDQQRCSTSDSSCRSSKSGMEHTCRVDSSTSIRPHYVGSDPCRLQAILRLHHEEDSCKSPITATVIIHAINAQDRPSKASFTNVCVELRPASNYKVADVDGSMFVRELGPEDRITLSLRLSKIAKPSDQDHFEELCTEIESMLDCDRHEIFTLKVTYNHPLFPVDTALVLRQSCTMSDQGVLPGVYSASSSAIALPQMNDTARMSGNYDRAASPINSGGERTRFRRPGYGISDPGHGTADISETVAPSTHQAGCVLPADAVRPADAAREVWRLIRRDSKTASMTTGTKAVKDDRPLVIRHDTGVVIAAMRNTALSNKRSVDEETIREWQENLFLTPKNNNVANPSVAGSNLQSGYANVPWL
ncbi:hypothetical protein KVT40_003015 [Elsinoe batatas]|uniref:Uncharacterized protein n=1 Tax=Elsinoe batatas TaxID=2601811 RepID=A0A8K0L586_9PEZI|nr:hypothetical protein KVT40_003015 [Elsinoe batatas]